MKNALLTLAVSGTIFSGYPTMADCPGSENIGDFDRAARLIGRFTGRRLTNNSFLREAGDTPRPKLLVFHNKGENLTFSMFSSSSARVLYDKTEIDSASVSICYNAGALYAVTSLPFYGQVLLTIYMQDETKSKVIIDSPKGRVVFFNLQNVTDSARQTAEEPSIMVIKTMAAGKPRQ
jgi:hypothetical protein